MPLVPKLPNVWYDGKSGDDSGVGKAVGLPN